MTKIAIVKKSNRYENEQIEYEMAYQKNREKEKFNLSESHTDKGNTSCGVEEEASLYEGEVADDVADKTFETQIFAIEKGTASKS